MIRLFRRPVGWLTAAAFFLSLPVVACAMQPHSVIGEWRLTSVLDSAEITAMDDDQAQRMLGTLVVVAPERVAIGKHVCSAPELTAMRVHPREHLKEAAHADADKLGLPDPVTVVQISCTYALVKSADTLVIYWDGYFFEAKRVR